MKIDFVEIQNFRKLKSAQIKFDDQTTLFVGANNSGKTSAMLALRYFLVSPQNLTLRDITIDNCARINAIGQAWEHGKVVKEDFTSFLPALDVWLNVPLHEIAHVMHIIPSINWSGGLIGVRLQYVPADLEKLQAEYVAVRKEIVAMKGATKTEVRIWPRTLTEFLEKGLTRHIKLNAYGLDPGKIQPPLDGVAQPQALSTFAPPLEGNPFKSLIRVNEIAAQRDFADAGNRGGENDASEAGTSRYKRPLSDQLRIYYDRHLDPTKAPSADDMEALGALQNAERTFNTRLKSSFGSALAELEDLGYPGVSNPKIKINTLLKATDGLRHGSAVEYEVMEHEGDPELAIRLPEDYSGLGYQNLVSMVFMLMGYRDNWMRVGKAIKNTGEDNDVIEPLHLMLIEEPEAHLHAQVQQVFIKKAYNLLRNHDQLREHTNFSTQLIVSTHSSHVAHEVDFSNLRYFRRHRPKSKGQTPTTTVTNLSQVFGDKDKTQQFVKRYLKATHCDLFFADAAIFIEGQAERILLPNFIRFHFPKLWRRYISLIELGGSHAHKFKELVNELGLTTLIITDLDAVEEVKKTNKNGDPITTHRAAQPREGVKQTTANSVLKTWHPKKESIDALLGMSDDDHHTPLSDDCSLYVAYQKTVEVNSEKVIPRTFEDALILENQKALSGIEGSSTSNKVKKLVAANLTGEELAKALFELLQSAEKAAFALECLMMDKPETLLPPTYIRKGLEWLDANLLEKPAADFKLEPAT